MGGRLSGIARTDCADLRVPLDLYLVQYYRGRAPRGASAMR